MIFTEKEQQAIHKILEVFINAKQKYGILKYINTTEKSHPLRNLLCEALFRNIILELYSVLYDTTRNTIANTINDQLNTSDEYSKKSPVIVDSLFQYQKLPSRLGGGGGGGGGR